jgi:hypothetical protein
MVAIDCSSASGCTPVALSTDCPVCVCHCCFALAQINVDTGAGARKTRLPDEIERQLLGRIVWMLDHNVPVAWEHVKLAANALAAIVDHQVLKAFARCYCNSRD